MRLIDADALKANVPETRADIFEECRRCTTLMDWEVKELVDKQPTVAASPWHKVEEELPKEAGEYIVAYHPCWWDDVKLSVTEVGIDTFRGKTSWAKRKFQRVTHWMEKPKPPKEEEHGN